MTTVEIRKYIYEEMTKHLENMCAYHATGNMDLFRYNAGKADGCRKLLEEIFSFDERYADKHVKAMWEIMDENW